MNILLKIFSDYVSNRYIWHFHKYLLLTFKLIILFWLFSASNAYAKSTSILFVMQKGKPFTEQIFNSIKSQSSLSNSNIQLIDYRKLDSAIIQNHDIIITLGSLPAKIALGLKTNTPLINLLITNQSFSAFKEQNLNRKNWSALVLDQPLQRQILFSKYLLGNDKKLGFLLGPYSSKLLSQITDTSKAMNISIAVEHINNEAALIPSIKALINNSDIILSLPDPVAFNSKTIRGILLLSYRNKTPVIGFSESYVKSGALGAVYSTPEQISQHASEIIVYFIKNRDFKQTTNYPRYYSIATNQQVARTLGITIKSNNELHELIKIFERTE